MPRQVSQVFASLGTAGYGSFGVSYAAQYWRSRPDIRLVSANYSVSAGKWGFLGVSLMRSLGPEADTSLSATLTIPLGTRTTSSVSATSQRSGTQATVQVQRNLPAGTGVGYRALAGMGGSSRQEVGVSAQNDVGTYSVDAGKAQGQTAFRASVSGAVVTLGGNAFMTRHINDSFGVVEVPGYPNVRVYADNQEVARTNANGIALVPRMRPYQTNAIRIDESDLPLDARIDATQLDAVPYYRSGVMIKLPVKKSRGGLIRVTLDSGEPLPAGAIAQLGDGQEEFPTGLRGEIYLTDLESENQVGITWRGQRCRLAVPFIESGDPVPDLGTYQCTGVQR